MLTLRLEGSRVGVEVALGEVHEHALPLLRLADQAEPVQEHAQGGIQWPLIEVEEFEVLLGYHPGEFVADSKKKRKGAVSGRGSVKLRHTPRELSSATRSKLKAPMHLYTLNAGQSYEGKLLTSPKLQHQVVLRQRQIETRIMMVKSINEKPLN